MASRRQERVCKRIMQELVEAFRNLKNADLGFITVTRCEISPDLRHANVYVSIWGDEAERERALGVLRRNASRLRGIIGRPLGTKVVPALHFEFDTSIATADEMSRLIRQARQTDADPTPLTPEEEAALRAGADAGGPTGDGQQAGELFDEARHDGE
ncbi:MAG: 30S ribosome-binding factor RbfA [Planctomycetes bacterium]|nr:30S ribosome-binding factor RbfA [Planctomycetota bacterium]